MKYILSGHEPVRCDDITEWGRFMWQHELRVVAQDDVGPHWVSTVFLGIDHDWSGHGPPILFETMIFTNGESREQWRFSTWDQAEEWHHAVVRRLVRKEDPDALDSRGVSNGTM